MNESQVLGESSKRRILIAGCGRSGTTLLLKLMKAFRNIYPVGTEAPLNAFSEFDHVPQRSIAVKRKDIMRFELHLVPDSVYLIYCVRHPFPVLTSKLPAKKEKDRLKRPYYVSVRRWVSEYNSYNLLRRLQPDRRVLVVRYEDIIGQPDEVQKGIADFAELRIRIPFSEMRIKQTHKVGNLGDEVRSRVLSSPQGYLIQEVDLEKWKSDTESRKFLYSFPNEIRREFVAFCDEFDYRLPSDYIQPDNRLTLVE